MKKTITLSATAFAIILGACNNSSNHAGQASSMDSSKVEKTNSNQQFDFDTTKIQSGVTFYQCPMHLEVISDQPGKCPKCDMDLEKVVKQ